MKILYLTDQIYLHGGVEKVLSQKANYLADVSGDDVVIVTHNQQGKQPVYQFSEKIEIIDLGIDYEIGKSYFHPDNLKKIPKHKAALTKLLKIYQPDVVISCSISPDYYFLPTLEKNIPKVKEFHSSRYFNSIRKSTLKNSLMSRMDEWTEKRYNRLIVLNEDEKHFYRSDRISVIPNPVESSDIQSNPLAKKILAAGRISPVKNFAELIDIFAFICKDDYDWELHIWGSDYVGTQKKLQDKINAYGMTNRIKFMGITADLKKEMENYSLYALTSETECFPMVLLEALSVGLPVISYDAPTGPKHILTHEADSFIVPYNNSVIFANQLKVLMMDANLRKEMGGRAKINAQRFEISKVMAKWKELFNQLTMYTQG